MLDRELFGDYISQGIALMVAENYEGAKVLFEKAIELDENSVEAYMHLGNANSNLSSYEEALSAFKNVLVLEPENSDALYSIASVYLLKNDMIKAVEYYNKAEEAGHKTAELYMILSTIFFEAGDSVQALRNINKAIELLPFEGELRLLKTQIYLGDNRYEEALETLEDMQKVLPDAFEAYSLRAQIYTGLGMYAEALEIASEGCKRFPGDPNLALIKLKVLVAMEDDTAWEVLASMKKMKNYEVVYKEAVMQEAILFLRKEDAKQTLTILDEANRKLGGDEDILFVLLDLCAKLENSKMVVQYAREMVGKTENIYYLSTAKYFLADATEKLGDQKAAAQQYRKLTSELRRVTIQNPGFYEGYIYRLLCHTKIKEYDKALSLADYLESLQPERTDANAFRYFIYNEMGDTEKAEAVKKLALTMDPDLKL